MKYSAIIFACLVFTLPSCALRDTGRDLIDEAKAGLAEAGRDIARAVGSEMRETAGEVLTLAKSDIGTALSAIPELAKAGGEAAAAKVIADRIAQDGDPHKAEEFARRAQEDGIGSAITWAFGGGATGWLALLALFWRTRGPKKALSIVTKAIEDAEHGAEVKAAVKASGGKESTVHDAIMRALHS